MTPKSYELLTTKEINEEIAMIQILKTSAQVKGKSTVLKYIKLDSFLFVMDKAIEMLKEF